MAGDEKVLRRGFTSYIGLSAIYSITPVKGRASRRKLIADPKSRLGR
jgi:hypothetical protein